MLVQAVQRATASDGPRCLPSSKIALMTGAKQNASSGIAPVVFVVDDDVSVRESLEALLADAGYRPEAFASAEPFLAHPRRRCPLVWCWT